MMQQSSEPPSNMEMDPRSVDFFLIHMLFAPLVATALFLITSFAFFAVFPIFPPSATTAPPMFPWYEVAGRSIWITVIVFFAGWCVGAIPVAIHAYAMILLAGVMHSRKVWVALIPIVGSAMAMMPFLILSLVVGKAGENWGRIETWAEMPMLACPGGAAALVCTYVAWRKDALPPMKNAKL